MKWQNKVMKFMSGRYGPDELYKFLFGLYILIFILNIFINSKYFKALELLTFVIMIYRFFSKKISKRKKENQIYLKYRKKFLNPFKNLKKKLKDPDNVYKKCHKCHKKLKLPLPDKRGIKHSKCPVCGHKNKFIVLKKLKIEIIKQKRK